MGAMGRCTLCKLKRRFAGVERFLSLIATFPIRVSPSRPPIANQIVAVVTHDERVTLNTSAITLRRRTPVHAWKLDQFPGIKEAAQ